MKNKVISELLYWSKLLLLPIYFFSFIIPRNKKLWVFGSTFGRRFADNPKFFYLYLNQFHLNEINFVWITKNKEVYDLLSSNHYRVYYLYTLKGIWYSLRAKVYLYDNYSKDISFILSGGAVKINLWHGIPLKKINMDNKFDLIRNPKNNIFRIRYFLRRMSDEKPSHYVLTTSEFFRSIFSSAFNTKKIFTCGYPRVDFLNENKLINIISFEENDLLNTIQKLKKKVILYMPTFRDTENTFFDYINIDRLENFLENHNMLFCVKLHPKSKMIIEFEKLSKDNKNIIIIDAQYDPYSYLNITDILVTDYSSVYFDFLYKDKPIIFFDYDKKEYMKNSRELYFDYEEFTPGEKVQNQSELEIALLGEDIYIDERKKLLYKIFDDTTNYASERLYQGIRRLLK